MSDLQHGNDDGLDGGDELQKRIDEAVAGLKRTNAELKSEKQALKKQFDELSAGLKELGGVEGLKQLRELRERLQKDDLGKLLTDGKYDEWFDQRTQSLRKDHENQLARQKAAVEVAEQRAQQADQRLHRLLLKTAVQAAAVQAGVEPSALEDIELRAERQFQFDAERGRLVMRDAEGGIVFGADAKSPKTVAEWLSEHKDTARHWWPGSVSGGASGSGRHGFGGAPNLEQVSFAEYKRIRDEQERQRR